jgi:hypothetical protein
MSQDRRTKALAVYLAAVACAAAVASTEAGNAGQDGIVNAVDSANHYAWYQAKTIRQQLDPTVMTAQHEIDRAELITKAKGYEALRTLADMRNARFSRAVTGFNCALALGAAAVLITGWWLVLPSLAAAIAGGFYFVTGLML